MTKFLDGPARGQTLMLQREAVFLRVTSSNTPTGLKWAALDQVEDTPLPTETVYAYRVEGEVGRCHILRRPTGSGWFIIANYRYVQEQPPMSVMRDNKRWRLWCEEKYKP